MGYVHTSSSAYLLWNNPPTRDIRNPIKPETITITITSGSPFVKNTDRNSFQFVPIVVIFVARVVVVTCACAVKVPSKATSVAPPEARKILILLILVFMRFI